MTDIAPTLRSPSGFDLTPPDEAERERLEADLSPEEKRVLLAHGTDQSSARERFSGVLPASGASRQAVTARASEPTDTTATRMPIAGAPAGLGCDCAARSEAPARALIAPSGQPTRR